MYDNMICTTTAPKKIYSKKFLTIGELFFTDKPMHIWTVLGPCVSVILHSPHKRISAMCHAQIVEKEFSINQYYGSGSNHCTTTTRKIDFRYVVSSINYMIDKFLMMGIHKNEIQASIYGGARLYSNLPYDIGFENVCVACEILQDRGIRIVNTHVGGEKSRVIRHYSDTGVTHVRVI